MEMKNESGKMKIKKTLENSVGAIWVQIVKSKPKYSIPRIDRYCRKRLGKNEVRHYTEMLFLQNLIRRQNDDGIFVKEALSERLKHFET